MKTIILSGGLGYRLKEETEFKPKPMVNVGDKPILWHIMKLYAHYGFNDFIIALGYKSDYIKQYFINQKHLLHDFTLHTKSGYAKLHKNNNDARKIDDFKVTFVDTGLETNPGERILRVKDYISKKDKYFMATYGDGVTDLDIRDLVKFHKKQKTIGTVTGIHPRSKYGLVNINKNNKIESFVEKPLLTDWVNSGFMVFDTRAFDYIKQGNPGEMEHEMLKRLANKKELSLFKHSGFWFAVDTNKELEDLNKLWNSGKAPWKVWK